MMKKHLSIVLALVLSIFVSSCSVDNKSDKNYIVTDNMIVFDEPERIEGQKSVLQLAVDPIPVVRIGFIGLGMRGSSAVSRISHIEGVEFKALCDLTQEHVDWVRKYVIEARNLPKCDEYVGEDEWKKLCERDDIDLVYICTDWKTHVPMAVYAMQHGKHVAIEVPAATSIEECWQLVDVAEQTQRHCMMLENCCYDFFELTCLNMAQQGLFGEVIHAQGAYIHNLEEYWTHYHNNWRLDFNQKHAGDVYPTHGLGPVCQVLDIHRGDKMDYLVSLSTPSINGLKIAKDQMGVNTFANGDMTSTLIKTNKGKTILIQHNVHTPRPYDRLYQLTGTEGFANKYPIEGFTLKEENIPSDVIPNHENLNSHGFIPSHIKDSLMVAYKHPIAKDIEEKANVKQNKFVDTRAYAWYN